MQAAKAFFDALNIKPPNEKPGAEKGSAAYKKEVEALTADIRSGAIFHTDEVSKLDHTQALSFMNRMPGTIPQPLVPTSYTNIIVQGQEGRKNEPSNAVPCPI